jgi:hypothetical protein
MPLLPSSSLSLSLSLTSTASNQPIHAFQNTLLMTPLTSPNLLPNPSSSPRLCNNMRYLPTAESTLVAGNGSRGVVEREVDSVSQDSRREVREPRR